MSHPAPPPDHIGGHMPGGNPTGAEHFSHTNFASAPPQWGPDPSAAGASPYQPYQQTAYQGYPPQYVPGMNPTNALAIASLVVSLFGWGPIAVILGHVALGQIRRSNGYERGEGLALAGLIIGYAEIAAGLLVLIGMALGFAFLTASPGA